MSERGRRECISGDALRQGCAVSIMEAVQIYIGYHIWRTVTRFTLARADDLVVVIAVRSRCSYI
jgi:hypothetical protein